MNFSSFSKFIFNRNVQGTFYQAITLILVILAIFYIVQNTAENMVARGLASGFHFLGVESQFDIGMTLIDYSPTSSYFDAFIVGLLNTLLVAGIGIFFATIIGFAFGIMRLSSNWLVAKIAEAYIEIIRNIPLLLQIFFWYFAVLRALPKPKQSIEFMDSIFLNNRGLFVPDPNFSEGSSIVFNLFWLTIAISIFLFIWAKRRQNRTGLTFPAFYVSLAMIVGVFFTALAATGFPISFEIPELKGFNYRGGMRLIPELVALTFALSMYTAAFIAEVVRAGILAVSKGQTEAARSVGLKEGLVLRLIIIPQALRVIVPPLTNQFLNLTKNSSLAAAIAYPDLVLVFAGTALMQTGQAIEIIGMVMGVYLFLSLFTSVIMNLFNRIMKVGER
ncbi:MAG: amino acid ABC transporter permease [Rickettsiales bacterium]|nr:amino acid ABC transporter permease [Rickettsiales bacterium]|tara:strand:- start:287 stop:1456 length:1170 start_codon:yes stop_codon:yes gene_type:complete